MRRVVVFLMMVLVFCGCEYDFPLKDSGAVPRLYVNCLAGFSDTTFVDVQTCLPINRNRETKKVTTVIEDISVEIDGVKEEVKPFRHDTSSVYNIYYLPRRVKPYEEVRLAVKAQGADPVSSRIRMPASPVIASVSHSIKVEDENWCLLTVDVLVGGNYDEDSCYGVEIFCHDEDGDYTLPIGPASSDESVSGESEDDWIPCGIGKFGVESFAVSPWNAARGYPSLLDGRTLLQRNGHIRISALAPTGGEFYVRLSAVTPEMYRYAKACYQIDNNLLASIGLAPAMFSYSNISGGFGVLAGLVSVTSVHFK